MSEQKPLQERVRSFSHTLQLLACESGFIPVSQNEKAKEFYEKWRALNMECIKSRLTHPDTSSFVEEQLRLLLDTWRPDIMEISIFSVFPKETPFASAYCYGDYLVELDRIIKAPETK